MLAAMRRVPIVVYYTTWCPVCTKARAWLAANRLDVTEHDVGADADAKAALRALNPRGSIPTFKIDGQVFIGFGVQRIWYALGAAARRRLDAR